LESEIFSDWLSVNDQESGKYKKHRALKEIDNSKRDEVIEKLAEWIINYHININTLKRKKRLLLNKYPDTWTKYLEENPVLPNLDVTKKGNGTEILLMEYLKATTKMDPLIYKLRYNPNADQSMKGDDVFLFNKDDLKAKLIVGEAKFRKTSTGKVVEEVSKGFSEKITLPISLNFVIEMLYQEGKEDLADELILLQYELAKNKSSVINVGLILSDLNIERHVNRNLTSVNPNFLIISIGINTPTELITKSFQLANDQLQGDNND
jgi:uncharacterized protein DUF1837